MLSSQLLSWAGKKSFKKTSRKKAQKKIAYEVSSLQPAPLNAVDVDAIAAITRDLCSDTDFVIHKSARYIE